MTAPPKLKYIPDVAAVTPQESPIVINGWEKKQVKFRVLGQMIRITREVFGGLIPGLRVLMGMRQKYRQVIGDRLLTKVAKVDGRYFWRLAGPGFPSAASVRMQTNEARRFLSSPEDVGLRTLFIAITKRCPLRCEHCFEADNLNQPDTLSRADIIALVHKYQDYGTTQIMFSGGEPMLRVNDIYAALDAARPATDFWVYTSGLGVSAARAQKLKDKGLTGMIVSLDDYRPDKHNRFRGFAAAWDNAIAAVLNAKAAGLVTALSLCATKPFISRENLTAYMDLAKRLGVAFVQLIEPMPTGGYRNQPVELPKEQYELLEEFYRTYNGEPQYQSYPIINYLGYHQRRVGCFGGGDRFFYIDTDGDAQVCPFCSGKVASALEFSAEDMIALLSSFRCHSFATAEGL